MSIKQTIKRIFSRGTQVHPDNLPIIEQIREGDFTQFFAALSDRKMAISIRRFSDFCIGDSIGSSARIELEVPECAVVISHTLDLSQAAVALDKSTLVDTLYLPEVRVKGQSVLVSEQFKIPLMNLVVQAWVFKNILNWETSTQPLDASVHDYQFN